MTDCVLALSQTKWFEWLAVMVISQPQGIILHIIIVLHNCLNCSECFQEHLMFYTCNYNIGVTHRNGAIKHIFTESDPRRDHQQIVLYSFCRSMRLLFIWRFKILLQIFLYEDLSTFNPSHLSVIFPHSRYQQTRCYATNIPNIWHKSSTKHKERSRPDWNDKNDNAELRALVSHGRFTNGSGCHF